MIEFNTGQSPGCISQADALELIKGPQTHTMLYGGARSGKTFVFTYAVLSRALQAPETTHAVLRFRFNHLKASIIYDTLPTVMRLQWPELGSSEGYLNKSDWFLELPNGSRVYFGGLDDAERTEKILGQEHSTIYLNECSQISWSARNKAVTRLAQNRGLRVKAFYDCNPPPKGHWTHTAFVLHKDPSTKAPLINPEAYAHARMVAKDNPHLPAETLAILASLPPKERVRFWEGQFGDGVEHALWDMDLLEACVLPPGPPPTMRRVVVAVDPSGCHGPEDKRSDEVGIVACGIGEDGQGYVLEDASGRYGPSGEDGWGAKACQLYRRWNADCVIAETNFGGAMVAAVVGAADPLVPCREVHANAGRGKSVRAEPVSTLYRQGRVKHLAHMPELEDQLLQFSTAGWMGDRSPDRADALVWGISDLMVQMPPGQGLLDWYVEQARQLKDKEAPQMPAAPARLRAPSHVAGTVYSRSGVMYNVEAGYVLARPDDVEDLLAIGFTREA